MAMVESNIQPEDLNVDGAGVTALRRRRSGVLVCPGDEEYEVARAVWNGMVDRRPALIAYCANRRTSSKPSASPVRRASARRFAAVATTLEGPRCATAAS
jgi:hypothetical protein